jgi:hypothetical protein
MRTDNFRQYPVNNAFGAIVQAGGTENLDTVFIAGRAKKFRGRMESRLLGHDLGKLRQRVDESRQYVLSKAGWTLDLFSD